MGWIVALCKGTFSWRVSMLVAVLTSRSTIGGLRLLLELAFLVRTTSMGKIPMAGLLSFSLEGWHSPCLEQERTSWPLLVLPPWISSLWRLCAYSCQPRNVKDILENKGFKKHLDLMGSRSLFCSHFGGGMEYMENVELKSIWGQRYVLLGVQIFFSGMLCGWSQVFHCEQHL